jgi:hypothetical protein
VCHAILPVRIALIELSKNGKKYNFVHPNALMRELLDFVDTDDDATDTRWDPRRLYQQLQSIQGPYKIDYEEVGDPSTTLMNMLHLLNSVGPEWERLLKASVWQGQTRQILDGRKQVLQRVKTGKIKSMACPLVLKPVTTRDNVQDMLIRAAQPLAIQGSEYPWDGAAPETYTERILEDSDRISHVTTWITTKRMEIRTIPATWLLHLERPQPCQISAHMQCIAESNNGTKENLTGFFINVPFVLKTAGLSNSKSPERLVLQGTILQVVEMDDEGVNDDGCMEVHCVVLLREYGKPSPDNTTSWVMIDDDKLEPVSNDRAQRLVNGTVENENGCTYFGASLLVYSTIPEESCGEDWKKSLLEEIKSTSDPSSFVGRRLKVRWSKGKFYGGKITKYDKESGKHTVEYDDGDCKEYILSKKTIEWIHND